MNPDHEQAGGAALTRCISCPPATFAATYWGRTALLSRANELPAGFDDLFGADAVDELVSTHGLRTPFARMARDGAVLAGSTFTRGGGAGASIADQLADDLVLGALADGSTLVLQGLHRTWPALVRFAAALTGELGHPVQVNSYVTPPENRGFSAHYDVHDVFVLQIAGRKRWTLHEPVVDAPLAEQAWESRRADVRRRVEHDEPILDTVLEPGDAMYLPRGTVHAAAALGETSIHLTVGVLPVTRRDLVRHLVELALDDAQLRASLPAMLDLSDPAVVSAELAETVTAFTSAVSAVRTSDVADRIAGDLMRDTRPEPIGPLAQLAALAAIDADSRLHVRGGLRARLDAGGDELRIALLGRTITVPSVAADAVKRLLDGPVLRVDELPGLAADDQLSLARRLVREGVAVLA